MMANIDFRSSGVVKCLFAVFFLLTTSSSAFAGQHWKSLIKYNVDYLVTVVDQGKSIYIDPPVDATREGSYYPFFETVQEVISSAVLDNDLKIDQDGLSNDYYFSTKFRVVDQGLELVLSLIEANLDSVVSTSIVELTPESLPKRWNSRTLRDIAYELVGKLRTSKLGFRSNLPVIVEEFLGGSTDNELYISELGITMRGYIREELSQSRTFRPLTIAESHDHETQPYRLKGHYQVNASSVIMRLVLLQSETNTEIVNISSGFSRSLIPSFLPVLPPNVEVASGTTDDGNTEIQQTDLKIWVNKDDLIYEHGDRLIVYLLPAVDLYTRVYYVDSNGEVCEIFPRAAGNGYLSAGKIRDIGKVHLKLTIDSSSTWGQESIKAFTSSAPIDDSAVPKVASGGCTKNYQALSRGIKLESTVQLATEIKILVRKPK